MTTQEQRVEFHKAVMDFKSACKKAYTGLKGASDGQAFDLGVTLARAELELVMCHYRIIDEVASEALSTALRNATPHTFEVTGCESLK